MADCRRDCRVAEARVRDVADDRRTARSPRRRWSPGRRCGRRSARRHHQPPSRRAVAAPMPEAPPVTIATRPTKSIDTILTHEVQDRADISIMWRRIGGAILALACAAAVALIDSGPTAMAVRGPNVVINELMVDPHKVYDSRGEWIELYNAGDEPANLLGWSLSDDSPRPIRPALDRHRSRPVHRVWPAKLESFDERRRHTAGRVRQRDRPLREERPADPARRSRRPSATRSIGVPGSRCRWAPAWRWPTRRADNNKGANWCASVSVMRRGDLGSPGAPNRCQPSTEQLVITEIMQNPRLDR